MHLDWEVREKMRQVERLGDLREPMPREPRVLEAIFRDIRDFLHLPVGTEEISLDFKLVIGAQPPLRNRQVIFLNNEKELLG